MLFAHLPGLLVGTLEPEDASDPVMVVAEDEAPEFEPELETEPVVVVLVEVEPAVVLLPAASAKVPKQCTRT